MSHKLIADLLRADVHPGTVADICDFLSLLSRGKHGIADALDMLQDSNFQCEEVRPFIDRIGIAFAQEYEAAARVGLITEEGRS